MAPGVLVGGGSLVSSTGTERCRPLPEADMIAVDESACEMHRRGWATYAAHVSVTTGHSPAVQVHTHDPSRPCPAPSGSSNRLYSSSLPPLLLVVGGGSLGVCPCGCQEALGMQLQQPLQMPRPLPQMPPQHRHADPASTGSTSLMVDFAFLAPPALGWVPATDVIGASGKQPAGPRPRSSGAASSPPAPCSPAACCSFSKDTVIRPVDACPSTAVSASRRCLRVRELFV